MSAVERAVELVVEPQVAALSDLRQQEVAPVGRASVVLASSV